MNRQNIRDLARKNLGETTASFWTNAELNTWINDAGTDIAFETKSIRTNGYITTVEDQEEYSISTDLDSALIAVAEVYFYQNATTWRRLEETNRERLKVEHPGWMSAGSGVPTQYYWSREEDLIGVYVPPDSTNAGTDYMRVYYSKAFTDLASDAAVPTLPEYLHMAMVHHVTATGYQQRGYGDKANDAWSKYHSRIAAYYKELKREREDEEIIMKPERNLW